MAVIAVVVGQRLQQPGWTRHELTLNRLPSSVRHWLGKEKPGLAARSDHDRKNGSGVNLRCREQVLISVVGEDAIAG